MPVETVVRRSRGLADIAPQYIAKSGLCAATEMESARGGSIRIQHLTATTSEGRSRFPKLDECAHFHYEQVELGPFQVSLYEEELKPLWSEDSENKWWHVSVTSQGKSWVLRRSYDNFRMLDQQLHRCIYDRKFSGLLELPPEDNVQGSNQEESIRSLLTEYLLRFSQLAGNAINCGPVLNWLELDNRGRRLLVPDGDNCPINTPAVAAAYAVRRYQAQAGDEISFEVGDMISVIDMPPPEESVWWRGKRGFQVGFFPSECVAVIGDKVPRSLAIPTPGALQPSKPVLRKHGKLIAFFRSFILARPSRRRLRQSGILKERVFGCDLGEHLLNSGHDIPMVLKCCAEFIETNGIVDGIYRLSGVTSNIQKLRNAFDEDRVPALYEDEAILQDIHSVASLLKMYFRELPNPLCTYQLYHTFVGAVQSGVDESGRLVRMRDAVHKLPPPHYRTLQYLVRHLAKVASRGHLTGMTPRNVAIVWAPNLLRCKELEVGGVAALQGVGVQAVVTEFLVCYADLIFCDRLTHQPSLQAPSDVFDSVSRRSRPKSLAISTPTKLLSLEEARSRALMSSGKAEQEYIEVGGGPANLPAKYHTIIELPGGGSARKRGSSKRSPLGWKSFFSKSGRKNCSVQRKASTPSELGLNQEKAVTESEVTGVLHRRLRPVKSAESLTNCAAHDVTSEMGLIGDDTIPGNGVRSGGHSRSVSHDSYFDQTPAHTNTHPSNRPQRLQEEDNEDNLSSSLDLSEIQLNFDLEETEMRIFSEDETLMSVGRMEPSPKRVQRPFGSTSPRSKRSRLEQRLACSPADLRYIDSQSPDSSAQYSDDLSPPGDPCFPFPLLVRVQPLASLSDVLLLVANTSENLNNFPVQKGFVNSNFQVVVQAEVYPTASSSPHEENLLSSGLTTPDTPLPTYAPLLEADSSAVTTPDYENLAGCSSLTPSPTLCITIKYGNVVRTSGLYQDMASNTYQEMASNNSVMRADYQNISNEGSLIYQNVPSEETISENLNSKLYQNIPQDQNYETVTSHNKTTESLTLNNSYETLNSTNLTTQSENNTPKTAFYQNFTDTVVYQNLSENADDENVYEDVQPKTETELYQQVKIFRNSVNEVNRLLEESGDSSAGESTNGVEDAENNKTMLSDISLETSFDEEVQTKILKTKSGSLDNFQNNLNDSSNLIESKVNIIENCDFTTETMQEIEKLSVKDDSTYTDKDFVRALESNSNYETRHSPELNSSDCLKTEDQLCMREIHDVIKESAFDDKLNLNLLGSKSKESDSPPHEHFEETCKNIPESIEFPVENVKFNEILSDQERDAQSEKCNIPFNDDKHNIFEHQIFETEIGNQNISEENIKSAKIEQSNNDELELSSLTIAPVSNNIRLPSKSDYSPPLDSSRRRFESEIGRDILRERRMKQELEEIRTACMASTSCENPKRNIKSLLNRFEHSASLPPCVRARVAKTARNKLSSSLSVSLDEDQFPTSDKQGLVRVSTSPDVNTDHEQGAQQQQYHHHQEECPKVNDSINMDDPQRRERIERYKEERRTFLREKYRSESFRGERDDILQRLKQKTSKLSTSPTDESHTVDRIKPVTRHKRESSVSNETVERKSKLDDGIKCKQGNAMRKYSEEKSPRSIRHRLSLDHKSPREGWGDEIKSDNIPIFESRVSFMSEDSSDRMTKCLVADQCASDSSIKRRLTAKVGGEESKVNSDTSPDRKCLTSGSSIDTKLVVDTGLHKQKAKVADKRFETQEMNAETLRPSVNVNSLETRPNSVDLAVDICRISKVGSSEKSFSEEAVKSSSPRRQITASQAPITPTSIRDIAALFENRDSNAANSGPSRPGKHYMSSV